MKSNQNKSRRSEEGVTKRHGTTFHMFLKRKLIQMSSYFTLIILELCKGLSNIGQLLISLGPYKCVLLVNIKLLKNLKLINFYVS